MKKVLVAGATGYLGRYVVQEFKKQGYWVRALARQESKLAQPGPFDTPAVLDQVDEVFVGQVTHPETLTDICAGVDVVFSSIGITRQKDGLTFQDVDYQGNLNLLHEAEKSDAGQFIYVSAFNADQLEQLAITKAHEDFVRVLQASSIPAAVIRPNGYYSDISEYFQMARSGRAYLLGKGQYRLNPIHGADLAEVCVAAADQGNVEIPVGGPTVYSQREIAELAFAALGKPVKTTGIPFGLAKAAARLVRLFSPHTADLFDFFIAGSEQDLIAPTYGHRELKAFFQQLADESHTA